MEQLRGFGHVLLTSLLSLAVCGLFAYVAMVIAGVWSQWPEVEWPLTLFIPGVVVVWGFFIGTAVITVLAAPAYVLLMRAGQASFISAAAIGVVPGIGMLLLTSELAIPAIATGLVVGLATHWVCRVRPNNSFKPPPPRVAD